MFFLLYRRVCLRIGIPNSPRFIIRCPSKLSFCRYTMILYTGIRYPPAHPDRNDSGNGDVIIPGFPADRFRPSVAASKETKGCGNESKYIIFCLWNINRISKLYTHIHAYILVCSMYNIYIYIYIIIENLEYNYTFVYIYTHIEMA